MAFGFPAYHQERAHFDGRSAGELMNAIDAVFYRLNWTGQQTGKWKFRVSTGISFWSWGETFTAEVEDEGVVFLRSECSFPTQCIDWGRNHSNVKKFLKNLDEVLESGQGRQRRSRDRDEDRDEEY